MSKRVKREISLTKDELKKKYKKHMEKLVSLGNYLYTPAVIKLTAKILRDKKAKRVGIERAKTDEQRVSASKQSLKKQKKPYVNPRRRTKYGGKVKKKK